MTKLNQIIALSNGTKSRSQKALASAHHKVQKTELVSGISRTYRPRDEDGDELPPEQKLVHYRVGDAIDDAKTALAELWNVVLTQDESNTKARADLVVDGKTLVCDLPVTTLLFLEKQAQDVATFIDKLPTLDPSEEWHFSPEANCYATGVQHTTRTKKVPRNHVKAEATKEHPAQVEVYMEDIIVGSWETVKFSGAIPQAEKQRLKERVQKFSDAVKVAREEANSIEVEWFNNGKVILGYLFETSADSD